MISRALLIVNPAARRGTRSRQAVERVFREAGVALEVLLTERPGHATELVRQAGIAHDAVFVLGGDGTVMETVSALAYSNRPVGVLPGGTGNLIAGVLGIPSRIPRAVRALLAGTFQPWDLARFESANRDGGAGKRGYFAFAAGLGIDVSMITATSSIWKRRLGVAAYVFNAALAALRRDELDLTATVDGTELQFPAALAMVVNSGSLFGGSFLIGPGISANDGTLDLCVFSPKSAMDVFRIAWRVWRKDFRPPPHPRMRYLKGRRIRLVSEPPREVQADGTIIGWSPIDIDIAPLAATFLLPRR